MSTLPEKNRHPDRTYFFHTLRLHKCQHQRRGRGSEIHHHVHINRSGETRFTLCNFQKHRRLIIAG